MTLVTVARLTLVEVTVAVSVTTVVSGVWDNQEEQKACPAVGSTVMAAKHLPPHAGSEELLTTADELTGMELEGMAMDGTILDTAIELLMTELDKTSLLGTDEELAEEIGLELAVEVRGRPHLAAASATKTAQILICDAFMVG